MSTSYKFNSELIESITHFTTPAKVFSCLDHQLTIFVIIFENQNFLPINFLKKDTRTDQTNGKGEQIHQAQMCLHHVLKFNVLSLLYRNHCYN